MKRYEDDIINVHKQVHPDLTDAIHSWHFVKEDVTYCEHIYRAVFRRHVQPAVHARVRFPIVRELLRIHNKAITSSDNGSFAIVTQKVRAL